MECDMVVALSQATNQGRTLFGLNHYGTCREQPILRRFAGGVRAADEVICLAGIELPQVRQTCTVLGAQPVGAWGLTHGINEHRVAAGFCRWQTRWPAAGTGLTGPDLIRLALERSQSARQALNVVTDLVCRYGQTQPNEDEPSDGIFLLADAREAFLVETAGSHWGIMECQQVRAVSDAGMIRQDWRRLAPGLADHAITQGWWPDNGSKLDLAGTLARPSTRTPWAMKRWNHATRQLEQQSGHIDALFLRRMLCDHYDASADCAPMPERPSLITSFLAVLPADKSVMPIAWCSLGPSSAPLYMPMFLHGELPHLFNSERRRQPAGEGLATTLSGMETMLRSPSQAAAVKETLERLQARIDLETDEFLDEAKQLIAREDWAQVARLAGVLMQNHAELLDAEGRQVSDAKVEMSVVGADNAFYS